MSYVYTHMHTSSYIYADMIHTYLPIYLCTCIYIYMIYCTYIHIYISIYICVFEIRRRQKQKTLQIIIFLETLPLTGGPYPKFGQHPMELLCLYLLRPLYIHMYIYIYISVFLYVCWFTGLLFFNTPTMMLIYIYISYYMLILRRLYPSKRFVLHHNSF